MFFQTALSFIFGTIIAHTCAQLKCMKNNIVIFCLAIIIGFGANAQTKPAETKPELKWYGWNEGYTKAQKEGKIVLVDAYTDWCGWCKRMDRDTYSQPEVIAAINQNFVPIKFNPEIQNDGYMIGDKKYNNQELFYMMTRGESTGFPTTYYIYPNKMSIFMDPGYKGPADFMKILEMAIAESKK